MNRGWSIKQMHRLIMLSNTYRASSVADKESLETDPENHLLSHMNRRRLDSDSMRDTILDAAGKLNLPSAPLTTLTVTGEPAWRALTTTPSRGPSGETTRPLSSARATDVKQSRRNARRIVTMDLFRRFERDRIRTAVIRALWLSAPRYDAPCRLAHRHIYPRLVL